MTGWIGSSLLFFFLITFPIIEKNLRFRPDPSLSEIFGLMRGRRAMIDCGTFFFGEETSESGPSMLKEGLTIVGVTKVPIDGVPLLSTGFGGSLDSRCRIMISQNTVPEIKKWSQIRIRFGPCPDQDHLEIAMKHQSHFRDQMITNWFWSDQFLIIKNRIIRTLPCGSRRR